MKHILIVDDDAQNTYMLEALLSGHGYEVTAATNGTEALESARDRPPDMIIADILMPVMDGFELCRQWKRDERLGHIPFVFYTATYTDPRDEKLAMSLGAERFVVKPQEPEVLLEMLQDVFDQHDAGGVAITAQPQPDETIYVREYNEALIRKLEQKMVQLEKEVLVRREVEAVLRESEEKHRRLFETMLQGVIYENRDGQITDANPAAERVLGLEVEQIRGRAPGGAPWRTIREDGSEFPSSEHPSMVAMRTGQPVENVIMGVCNPHGGPTRWISVDAMPLFRPGDDAPHQVYTIFDDVTERKQAEMERERLLAAIEQTGDIVMITDPLGTIQYVNPAFETVTGYSRADAVGGSPRMLSSGRQEPAFYRDLWETISAGKIWSGRLVNKRSDGTLYTEEATISPVVDALGRIVNYVAVKRDITEHLQLEQQFRQAMKMEAVGRLAGGVAHDFNNALTPLSMIIDMMLAQIRPGDPWYDDIKEMERSSARCANLARQLLAFGRSQATEASVFSLNDVVGSMVKMLSHVIGEDVELVECLDPQLAKVRADMGQMEQIIANLAINARDAMPNGGRLTIRTENAPPGRRCLEANANSGPHVMLAVSDTGTGMDEQTRARIFEPFFSTKDRGKGTGLGLSTVYGIVKQSGGAIQVDSEPGKGTTMSIYLPCADDQAEEDEPSRPAPAQSRRGSETILLVEDEESVRTAAKRVLSLQGYTVLEAPDGTQAIAIAESHDGPIHLIIADVVMPGMSGPGMADRIATSRPEAGVIYISGYKDDTVVTHGVLDGGDHFIQKPFSVEALTAKVREVLDGG